MNKKAAFPIIGLVMIVALAYVASVNSNPEMFVTVGSQDVKTITVSKPCTTYGISINNEGLRKPYDYKFHLNDGSYENRCFLSYETIYEGCTNYLPMNINNGCANEGCKIKYIKNNCMYYKCVPNCAGKTCGGDDGCGKSCGTCSSNQKCENNKCVSTVQQQPQPQQQVVGDIYKQMDKCQLIKGNGDKNKVNIFIVSIGYESMDRLEYFFYTMRIGVNNLYSPFSGNNVNIYYLASTKKLRDTYHWQECLSNGQGGSTEMLPYLKQKCGSIFDAKKDAVVLIMGSNEARQCDLIDAHNIKMNINDPIQKVVYTDEGGLEQEENLGTLTTTIKIREEEYGRGELGSAVILDNLNIQLSKIKLIKIFNHELGHAFNLKHSTSKNIMFSDTNKMGSYFTSSQKSTINKKLNNPYYWSGVYY